MEFPSQSLSKHTAERIASWWSTELARMAGKSVAVEGKYLRLIHMSLSPSMTERIQDLLWPLLDNWRSRLPCHLHGTLVPEGAGPGWYNGGWHARWRASLLPQALGSSFWAKGLSTSDSWCWKMRGRSRDIPQRGWVWWHTIYVD